MPTQGQKVDILFKKFISNKATVIVPNSKQASFAPNSQAFHSELFGSKQTIFAEQVLTQTKYIPTAANPLNKEVPYGLRTINVNGALYTDTINSIDPAAPILSVDGKAIVQRIDLQINNMPGFPYTWAFPSLTGANAIGGSAWTSVFGPVASFKGYNIIPFSFDSTGTYYRHQLFKTKTILPAGTFDPIWGTPYTLTGEIPFLNTVNEWFFDQDSLVVNFMNENVPADVASTAPLYVRCYRYVGTVGDFGGGGSPSALSSTTAYIENAAASSDLTTIGLANLKETVYVNVQGPFTHAGVLFQKGQLLKYDSVASNWAVVAPTDGLRLLARAEEIININTFNPGPPASAIADDDVAKNSILEYWNVAQRGTGTNGFVVLTPTAGQRIAITSDGNRIWTYSGTTGGWIQEVVVSNKGSVSNKDMQALVTGKLVTGSGGSAVTTYSLQAVSAGLLELPSGSGYIEVQVNGVAISLGDGYSPSVLPSACFAKLLPGYSVGQPSGPIGSEIMPLTFTQAHGLITGDQIAYITAVGTFFVPTVTVTSTTAVTIPAAFDPGTMAPQAWEIMTFASITTTDKLIWFGPNAKFELDANDRVSYNYVSVVS